MPASPKRQPWWGIVEQAVEDGMTLGEAARLAERQPKTLYNLLAIAPDFRAEVDGARARYHRRLVNTIERIGANELEPIMADIADLPQLDPAARPLARQRLVKTLEVIQAHHLREAEKVEGRGELAKSELLVRHAPPSEAEWQEFEAELEAELEAQQATDAARDTESDADPADDDPALDP